MKHLLRSIPVIAIVLVFQPSFAQTKWNTPSDQRYIKNPLENNKAVIPAARQLYTSMCISCHGENGKGDGTDAAALTPKPANYTSRTIKRETDGSLYWKMTTGHGPMKAYGEKLTDAQRWGLVSYIRTLEF